MNCTYDLIVLGAGPAGANAAIIARDVGLSVAIIDEGFGAGGQVYRPQSPAILQPVTDSDSVKGENLRRRLLASGAALFFGHRVWSVTPEFTVVSVGPDGPTQLQAPNLIVATGALERHIPVPGWTLPGVVGLAAATVMLKSHQILPGRRVVVAGSGPLLLLVAAKIIAAGSEVAAVVDAARQSRWLSRLGSMLARPDLSAKGLLWILSVLKARVPLLSGYAVRSVQGVEGVTGVTIGEVDRDWSPIGQITHRFHADALCIGFGLVPSTDVTRLLNAVHVYRPDLGGWIAEADSSMQSSVEGLFVAGDGGGVRGADAAPISGALAALGAARRLGRGSDKLDGMARRLTEQWRKSGQFGAAMSAIAMPPLGAQGMITSDTVVCRCEGLSRATLDAAICSGSKSIDDLKASTRCGMGPCGGRVCGEASAMLMATQMKADRATVGMPTARPPLRPVLLSEIAGTFNYDDLPIPEPAPL